MVLHIYIYIYISSVFDGSFTKPKIALNSEGTLTRRNFFGLQKMKRCKRLQSISIHKVYEYNNFFFSVSPCIREFTCMGTPDSLEVLCSPFAIQNL